MGNSSQKQQKSRDAKEPGAPMQVEGATKDTGAAAPAKVTKFNEKNYKLLNSTDVQFETYSYKAKSVDFYGLVTIDAPAYEKDDRPGIDCVCVLDVSGSMAGQKISLVRKSMRRLVRNLGSKDRVCFITFDTNVNTLMDFTLMDDKGKERARNLVKNLQHGSSTNLAGGLVTGIEALRDNFQNEVTSVLLFTDGEANVGEQSIPGILALAKEAAGFSSSPEKWTAAQVQKWLESCGLGKYVATFQENAVDGMMLLNDITPETLSEVLQRDLGVKALHLKKFEREILALRQKVQAHTSQEGEKGPQLHLVVNTFGFGAQHNNELLDKIASSFDGMYFFMKDEGAIVAGFANCLGGMLSTVAQDINVTVRPCTGVKNLKVHKDENTTQNKDGSFTVAFGDLQSEEKRHVLLSATIPKLRKADPCYKFFDCEVVYRNLVREIEGKECLTATINRSGKIGKANTEVDISKNRVTAADAMLNAELLAEKGSLEQARKLVTDAKANIEKSVSANEEFCLNLVKDLAKCLEGLQDKRNYDLFGKGYMIQNQRCLYDERGANFDVDFAAQSDFNNCMKEEAFEAFQRSDSMDSCPYDRRSASPINLVDSDSDDLNDLLNMPDDFQRSLSLSYSNSAE